MSKRERREWEIRPRGKRRGGILTLLDPDENPITDDLIKKAATPKLRKQMEALRKLHAYQIAHPMDPRPMREADALAREGLPEPKQLQIGSAVEEAMKYGLEIGRRAALFGLDAKIGRDLLRRTSNATDANSAAAAARHADWQARADTYWRDRPGLTLRKTAELIIEALCNDGKSEHVKAVKTIMNNTHKPSEKPSRSM
jgi:hypothetical protein